MMLSAEGKWRCINDGRRSKYNAATGTHKRIVCGRADFSLMAAREFGKRFFYTESSCNAPVNFACNM